jgi:O-antigen biosynthesis protein WbqV
MKSFSKLTLRNLLIAIHDTLTVVFALLGSVYFRFDGDEFTTRLPLLLQLLPYIVAFSIVVFFIFNLTTTKWRFISVLDVLNIVHSATILALALILSDYVLLDPNIRGGFFLGKITIVLYWFLQVFFLSALRFAYRYFRHMRVLRHTRSTDSVSALLVGRSADAEILLRGIESGAVKRLMPIGLLSPSHADQGQIVRNTPVLGDIADLEDAISDCSRRGIRVERLIMMPSAFEPNLHPEAILMRARRLGLIVSRLPLLESGERPRLAPVAVEDLLLRPSQKIEHAKLKALIQGKAIAVTGGGGSIGSEICERVVKFGAARLLIIEHSEPALYSVTESLSAKNGDVVIDGRIADIRDRNRLFQVMEEFKADIVFHAAALKHVPILECDASEGVKTNIFGSINVADAALATGAKAMVMISTDKAIEPVSMLGLTKRFAEMYCQALDREIASKPGTEMPMRLISVRFGNVLASNGSVVPKFKSQIESGGPITVTHPDMVRYFMTIREACDLVVTAATHALAQRSEVSVYVLNMGQPVKIMDLAERMIRLSGLEPGYDVEIVFTGIRPGERLHEILFASQEPTVEIGLDGIMAAKPLELPMSTVRKSLALLHQAVIEVDEAKIRSILKAAVVFDFRSTK